MHSVIAYYGGRDKIIGGRAYKTPATLAGEPTGLFRRLKVPKKVDGETRDARIVILLRPSEKARYLKMCEGKGEDFSRHAYKSLMGELEAWEAAN